VPCRCYMMRRVVAAAPCCGDSPGRGQPASALWGGCRHAIILINQQTVDIAVEAEQSPKLTCIQLNAACNPGVELLLAGRLG